MSSFIKPTDVGKLINLVEDESIEVRSAFIGKLKDFIGDESISIKYLPLVFFTAYEPDAALRTSTRMWIRFTLKKDIFKKGTFFERALPRLIHSIAHHPDVEEGLKPGQSGFLTSLTTAIDYLVFYFDAVLDENNLGLLYYLAGRVRQYKDAIAKVSGEDSVSEERPDEEQEECPGTSSNIYIISELAQLVLGEFKEHNEWTLPSYPGKLNLPSDLFEPFETIDEARKNTFETYLRTEDTSSLRRIISLRVSKVYRRNTTSNKPAIHKRKHSEGQRQPRKRAQITSRSEEEAGEESDDENYVPSNASRKLSNETRRSSRHRRTVDYADASSEED